MGFTVDKFYEYGNHFQTNNRVIINSEQNVMSVYIE